MRFSLAVITAILGVGLAALTPAPAPEVESHFNKLAERGPAYTKMLMTLFWPECTAACILACMPFGGPNPACYGPCFAACIASAQDGGEVPGISVINGTLVAPDGTAIFAYNV
ncbi:hypothetical protein BBP40_007733 [Aspergillus hancockii]|nr:hypothetical protein BBP40_007733 [Aspergillus hancockii]